MLAVRRLVAGARPERVLAGLALSVLFGCVHAPPPAPAAPVAPGPAASAPAAASAAAPAAPTGASTPVPAAPPPAAAPRPHEAPSPPAHAAAGASAPAPAPKRATAAAAPGAAAAAATAPAPTAPGTGSGAEPAARAAPALDLASLEQRLRDTHAIGLFTKLSLKNQVDDLLAQFRAFYGGQGGFTLPQLRRSYELLLMKVVTLLQDDDPGLAGAVSSSREAIWSILSDRNRFNNL